FRVDGCSNPGRFFSDVARYNARSVIFRQSVHVLWFRPQLEFLPILSLSCQARSPRAAKYCGATILGWAFTFDRRSAEIANRACGYPKFRTIATFRIACGARPPG